MNFVSIAKRCVPQRFRPPLRKCLSLLLKRSPYKLKLQSELSSLDDVDVQDVPKILHYWANKFLAEMMAPFGFTNSIECFRLYLARLCRQRPNETLDFLSVGAGTCASEINIAECCARMASKTIDLNAQISTRACFRRDAALADEKGLSKHFTFTPFDVNRWKPRRQYYAILAFQSLHHSWNWNSCSIRSAPRSVKTATSSTTT